MKYGFIYDTEFLSWLEANVDALNAARVDSAVMYAVKRSCEIKAQSSASTNASKVCARF